MVATQTDQISCKHWCTQNQCKPILRLPKLEKRKCSGNTKGMCKELRSRHRSLLHCTFATNCFSAKSLSKILSNSLRNECGKVRILKKKPIKFKSFTLDGLKWNGICTHLKGTNNPSRLFHWTVSHLTPLHKLEHHGPFHLFLVQPILHRVHKHVEPSPRVIIKSHSTVTASLWIGWKYFNLNQSCAQEIRNWLLKAS